MRCCKISLRFILIQWEDTNKMLNSTSQIGNYSSQIVNQQVASTLTDTDTNTENKLVSRFLTVGNSNIDLDVIVKKENDLFDAVKNNQYLLTISNTPESTEQAERFRQAGLAIGIVDDFSTVGENAQITAAKIKTNHICNDFPINNQIEGQETVIENRGKAFVASFLSASTLLDPTAYAQALNIGSAFINKRPTDSLMVNHFSTMWNVRDGLASSASPTVPTVSSAARQQ